MKSAKEILNDEKAPVIVLLWLITREYGEECYEWEPEVLKLELEEDFDCKLSDLQSDKIQAGITILTTEQYETALNVFETLNYLLCNQPDDFDTFNPLEAEELIAGLTEAYLIRTERLEFSPEIRVYAGKIFYDYGMHKPPTLFPEAIMQETEGDDEEKNAALQEIFDARLETISSYFNECTNTTAKKQ
jgi:hypothetical protein